jgi:hypothetical protein
MAIFGSARDVSMIRKVNRELMGNVISQECVYYKVNEAQTLVNMYGEQQGGRYFSKPVIFNCLIEVGDQTAPTNDGFVGFDWPITFRFLRDDLVDANLVPAIGDFIMYQNAYWEVDNENMTHFFVGKDPDYPYNVNPLNPGLEFFGYNVDVICQCHYVPQDRINIVNARY